jgi:antitoxin ChpS
MHKTSLRKVGGSVMLTVPPVMLDLLQVHAGAPVGVSVEKGRLIVRPETRPQYRLSDLLAESKFPKRGSRKDRAWLDAPPVGGELL